MALPTVKLGHKRVELYPDQRIADEVETAERALDEARAAQEAEDEKPSPTVASKARTATKKALTEAEKALAAVKERAAASVLEVVIPQLPKKAWVEFEAKHPPREGDKTDETWTINWDAFVGPYLQQVVPEVRWKASGEAVEVAAAEWPAWVETIADPEYQKLALEILSLNRKPVARPF